MLLKLLQFIASLFKGKTDPDLKELQEYYRQRITDLRKELEDDKVHIEKHRSKHPDNGIELDEWKQMAEQYSEKLIAANRKIMELEEQAIFLKADIDRLKKGKRSMYE